MTPIPNRWPEGRRLNPPAETACGSPFKLYVLGQFSADPEEWAGDMALVVARDKEEAIAMVDWTNMALEVPLDRPLLLSRVLAEPENL